MIGINKNHVNPVYPVKKVPPKRLSSFLVYACSIFREMWFFEDEKPPSDG